MSNPNKTIDEIIKRHRNLDEKTLKTIATRLNSFRGLGLVDFFDLGYFTTMYAVMVQIEKEAERTRRAQVKELEQLLNTQAKQSYDSMKQLYIDGGKEYIPYKNNEEIRDYVAKEVRTQSENFNSTLMKIGYPVIDDATGSRVFHSPSETYQYLTNRAKSQVTTNPLGYDGWTRKVMRRVLRDGLKIYNYNQDTRRYKQQNSYSYIRNFVKDAVYRTCQGVYNVIANQVGIDGVELSAHADCALDHIDIQGHQFTLRDFHAMQSNDDFYDVQGNHFAGLDRAIGTWNCRHYVYPIILGKSRPHYTHEQLQQIKENRNMIYATAVDALGDKAYIPFGDFNRYRQELQDRADRLGMDMRVAEKLGDAWLVDYYKTRLAKCKAELASMKMIKM